MAAEPPSVRFVWKLLPAMSLPRSSACFLASLACSDDRRRFFVDAAAALAARLARRALPGEAPRPADLLLAPEPRRARLLVAASPLPFMDATYASSSSSSSPSPSTRPMASSPSPASAACGSRPPREKGSVSRLANQRVSSTSASLTGGSEPGGAFLADVASMSLPKTARRCSEPMTRSRCTPPLGRRCSPCSWSATNDAATLGFSDSSSRQCATYSMSSPCSLTIASSAPCVPCAPTSARVRSHVASCSARSLAASIGCSVGAAAPSGRPTARSALMSKSLPATSAALWSRNCRKLSPSGSETWRCACAKTPADTRAASSLSASTIDDLVRPDTPIS
mmetsp:Transcript_24461/g.85044  ORF Transcript_24461/g.85044 Transcript_24461/m.85044 type:complete len:338 (+) Transcript_24461:1875-2888(+)